MALKKMILSGIGAAAVIAASTLSAGAQETGTRVGFTDVWSVFVWDNPKACSIASAPTTSKATRSGKVVAVSRGDIYLIVTDVPSQNVTGEVAFVAGYPFRKDSTVRVKIGNESFDLFTDGERAWPEDTSIDKKLVDAMRRGATATVTGVSSRGTTTIDTFSLKGFTASLKDAQDGCK